MPAQAMPTKLRLRTTVDCVPATWQDVLLFILVNYVNSLPGETGAASAIYNFVALLLPFTGAWRGIRAIKSAAFFGGDKLQRAARAGALCVVARAIDWRPMHEKVHGCTIQGHIAMDRRQRARLIVAECQDYEMDPIRSTEVRVHGQCSLPPGYYLVRLPENVKVLPEFQEPVDIASSHGTAKVILSLTQLGFACATLYDARGSQFQYYGYASFSLTVMPYAIMSFINLIGNLVAPSFSTVYMARSEVMDEAKARGGKFDGTIGFVPVSEHEETGQQIRGDTISFDGSYAETEVVFFTVVERGKASEPSSGPPVISVPSLGRYIRREKSLSERRMTTLAYVLVAIGILFPYIIIAALTNFNSGSSTNIERLWTMSWLVVGQVAGIFVAFAMKGVHGCAGRTTFLIPGAVLAAPAIGGLVTVANMIKEFGQCVQI